MRGVVVKETVDMVAPLTLNVVALGSISASRLSKFSNETVALGDVFGQQLLHLLQAVPRRLREVKTPTADKLKHKLALVCYALLGFGYMVFGLAQMLSERRFVRVHRRRPSWSRCAHTASCFVVSALLRLRPLKNARDVSALAAFKRNQSRSV
jgi:hypothetical protein